jgi:hypothetical protein
MKVTIPEGAIPARMLDEEGATLAASFASDVDAVNKQVAVV